MENDFEKLTDTLTKIEFLAQTMKITLLHGENMTALDWYQMGISNGQLSRYVDILAMDAIELTQRLYNPIPGKKLS